MKSSRLSRLKKWSLNGAIIGFVFALVDITGWRGQNYVPWTVPGSTITNISIIVGTIVGGAFIFLLAAFVANLIIKD